MSLPYTITAKVRGGDYNGTTEYECECPRCGCEVEVEERDLFTFGPCLVDQPWTDDEKAQMRAACVYARENYDPSEADLQRMLGQ